LDDGLAGAGPIRELRRCRDAEDSGQDKSSGESDDRHYGNAQTPSRQMPEAQTLLQVPQFCASKRMSTHLPLQQVCDPRMSLLWQHVRLPPEPQVCPVGQQYGLRPGPTLCPAPDSAT
jgi:hypothetical protein